MNILLMSRMIVRSGVGNHIKQLAEELIAQGHSVWIITGHNDLVINGTNGMNMIPLTSKNPIACARNLFFIRRFVKEKKIDIVHCHHRTAALYLGLINLFNRVPFVYTLHIEPIPCDWFHRLFTFTGTRTIAISNEVMFFLSEKLHVPKHKISLVLNGVDEKGLATLTEKEKVAIRKEFGISSDKIVISIHSRISDIKNQRAVIDAYSLLDKETQDKLVFICSGETNGSYYNSIKDTIQQKKIQSGFIFCGWRGPRDVIGVSDYMMLPSKSEGFPLNVIEAMFLRVPVIRTKTGGYSNVKDYVVALDSYEPDYISNMLRRIAEGDTSLSKQVNAAYSFAQRNCTVEAMTKKTVDVYHDACNL